MLKIPTIYLEHKPFGYPSDSRMDSEYGYSGNQKKKT